MEHTQGDAPRGPGGGSELRKKRSAGRTLGQEPTPPSVPLPMPSARLGGGIGLRFERGEAGSWLRLPMAGRDAAGLDVTRVDDDLVIGVDGRRRRIALPAGFSELEVERVSLEDASLFVAFGAAAPRGGGAS